MASKDLKDAQIVNLEMELEESNHSADRLSCELQNEKAKARFFIGLLVIAFIGILLSFAFYAYPEKTPADTPSYKLAGQLFGGTSWSYTVKDDAPTLKEYQVCVMVREQAVCRESYEPGSASADALQAAVDKAGKSVEISHSSFTNSKVDINPVAGGSSFVHDSEFSGGKAVGTASVGGTVTYEPDVVYYPVGK